MRKNKKVISFMLLSAMALASVTSVSGATNSNTKTKMIAVGDTVNQLEDNTENAANYKWTSSNKAVATVNKKGIVTAKKEGTAVITQISKIGKKEKKVITTFKVVSLKKQGTKTVVAGEKLQLNKKQYKGATYQWTTSDRSVATVNKKGEVIGNGQGTAIIRCYAQSSKKSYVAQYTIKVNTEKKVVTQSQLTKALNNDKLTSIVIETKKDVEFVVPEGEYKNIDLSINAPNADVENHGVFKSIKILMIKPNTWHEKANGNKIVVKALQARIVVEDGASVDAVRLAKKNAELKVEVNGTVGELKVGNSKNVDVKANGTIEKLSVNGTTDVKVEANGSVKEVAVNSAAQLKLSGNTKEEIPVSVSESAKGAKVNSAVKVKVDTAAKVEVSLEKGAEGSAIKVSDDKIEVAVKNDTIDKVTVTSPAGDKEIDAGNSTSSSDNDTTDSSNNSNQNNGSSSIDEEDSQTIAQQSGLQIVNVESVENGKVRLTLNKAYPQLTKEMISIICTTGGSDMTVQRIQPSEDYKTFDIITAYYDDNAYSLAIVFSDNSLIEKEFVSKYDCPSIEIAEVKRISDDKAVITYTSDEVGSFYYIVKEDTSSKTRSYSTKAVHTVPNQLDGITESDMLKNGIKISMTNRDNKVEITGLNKNVSYQFYYMAQDQNQKTTLIKRLTITNEVAKEDTSDITITDAKLIFVPAKGNAALMEARFYFDLTLNKPTEEKLTVDAFSVVCPANGVMTLDTVESSDNQHYRVYMKKGSIPKSNNVLKYTVRFSDGTSTSAGFYADYEEPRISSYSFKRTGETTGVLEFTSNEDGYLYYKFLTQDDVPQDISVKDPSKVTTDGTKISIQQGGNYIEVENVEGDYICLVTEDALGNQMLNFLPIEVPEYVETEEPSENNIFTLSVDGLGSEWNPNAEGGYATTVTLVPQEGISLDAETITIIGNGASYTRGNKGIYGYSGGPQRLTLQLNAKLKAGTYKVIATVGEKTGTTEFEIK